jgi:signal transduction histidine kinase
MSPATAISVTTTVVSLLVAVVALVLARGTSSRAMRWFAWASGFAALFGVANIPLGLEVSPIVTERASRVSLFATGLHGASWVVYAYESEGRRAGRFERLAVLLATGFSFASLVPGLLVSSERLSRVSLGGIVYHDAVPTGLGEIACAYYCVALGALAVQYGRRIARIGSGWPEFVGLSTLTLAAILDSLAYSRLTQLPYLVDLALVLVVVCIGASIAVRFVENAQALEESTRRLERAQVELVARERLAALGEMSAIVAHEVRNPLAVMFNALASLRRELGKSPPGSAPALLGILQEEAERLRRLVDDFLDFARPIALRPAIVDAAQLVRSAIEIARAGTPSEHRVVEAIAPDLGRIHCDDQLVRHAIANLVANALQIEGPAGAIEVRARATEGRLTVAIIDGGPGVSVEAQERLFSPFFTTRARGTGLGLTVVRRIALAHGGSVHFEPTPGGGATFVFELPREVAARAPLPLAAE